MSQPISVQDIVNLGIKLYLIVIILTFDSKQKDV